MAKHAKALAASGKATIHRENELQRELKKELAEKEVLLSLTRDICQIRTRHDLATLVKKQFREFFAIWLYNSHRKTCKIFICYVEEKRRISPDFITMLQPEFPVDDGIHNVALCSKEPVVIDIESAMHGKQKHPYGQFLYDSGIKRMLVDRLSINNDVIGFLNLLSKDQHAFVECNINIVKGISDQLSTAVSNILSIEETRSREEEKSLLLSFSNDIASVRDKSGLRVIIRKYLKDIFRIKEYIITIRNDDNESFAYFIHDLSSVAPADKGFEIITGPKMPIQGSMTGAVLAAEEPICFNIAKILESGEFSFPSESFWKAAGAENIMGIKLKVGEDTVGILWVQPGQINEGLMRGITAQMSIAIANTIANEKIEAQLSQINNYKQQLVDEKLYLQEEAGSGYTYSDIIGTGPAMQRVFQLISQVSFVNSTVLILGETGTGKELIARALHNGSSRKDKLMVKVNCAALPPNLIESELFGHERGSFTGATERRIGKFELANNGTLFLDEIGEMPLDLQVKLLRAIQEKEIERVGGKTTIKTDVRLIAATNRDLQKEVDEGRFRRDLYYRLNVFPLSLPPLRDRKDDIPLLANHFIEKYSKNAGRKVCKISRKAMKQLVAYSWPGNVRELEHSLERSVLLTEGEVIREMHLPADKSNEIKSALEDEYVKTFEENERDHIIDVLNKCNGKIFGAGGAAELLNINVNTLNSKIKKLGIQKGRVFFRRPI